MKELFLKLMSAKNITETNEAAQACVTHVLQDRAERNMPVPIPTKMSGSNIDVVIMDPQELWELMAHMFARGAVASTDHFESRLKNLEENQARAAKVRDSLAIELAQSTLQAPSTLN